MGKGTNKLDGEVEALPTCRFYGLVNEHVALGGQRGTKV